MSSCRNALARLFACGLLAVAGCTGLQSRDPIQVFVVGVEPLQGEGLELRMRIKLRVQNPNDLPLDFSGVSVQLDVQGRPFATGVSDAGGRVPRYGETIVDVPVSISMLRIAGQAIGAMTSESTGKLTYELSGKLAGTGFNGARFKSKGELTLPAEISGAGQ